MRCVMLKLLRELWWWAACLGGTIMLCWWAGPIYPTAPELDWVYIGGAAAMGPVSVLLILFRGLWTTTPPPRNRRL
jgi:hypothetical protein